MPIFSWSALVLGSTLSSITGSGNSIRSRMIGCCGSHSVSPVVVSLRPAIATISPAKASSMSRSEEHTSELQSLMRISSAVFCLKKQKQHTERLLITNKNNKTKIPTLQSKYSTKMDKTTNNTAQTKD